jgi:hypothetical protein
MTAPYQITHLLSYSPNHKDALDVNKAVESIKNWDSALVGSVDTAISVLVKLGYTPDDIATTLHFAFMNSPINLTAV